MSSNLNWVLDELAVSRETLARLETYAELLIKWNARINLVAPSTVNDLWQRHFRDSAQLWLLKPKVATSWLDLGSGAGFPGMVIAAIAAEKAPELTVTLVESDLRKATFLRTVAQALSIQPRIQAVRIEELPPSINDVVSARALAPLGKLLAMAKPHFGSETVGLFPKGAMAEAEVEEALAFWRFSVQNIRSQTDPRATILRIGELSHA